MYKFFEFNRSSSEQPKVMRDKRLAEKMLQAANNCESNKPILANLTEILCSDTSGTCNVIPGNRLSEICPHIIAHSISRNPIFPQNTRYLSPECLVTKIFDLLHDENRGHIVGRIQIVLDKLSPQTIESLRELVNLAHSKNIDIQIDYFLAPNLEPISLEEKLSGKL